ncbi:MAG TPA: hypothetical protein VHZ55_15680 [Bryobacteraceae bacterium]|jgi:hypothetical protein|nr:hypothetical protein [Bryobacteraceae bacterium]
MGTTQPLPPQPIVPQNPVETGLPHVSEALTFGGGQLLNYLPVSCVCVSNACKPTITTKSPIVGVVDPSGNQHGSGTFSGTFGQLLFTWMIDPASDVADDSLLIETDYWQLQFQDIVQANQGTTLTESVVSGLTTATAETFSKSLGAKVNGELDAITGELSEALSQSFSRTITISSQQTVSRSTAITAQSFSQIIGLYQLMQSFQVIPGANLTQFIAQLNKNMDKGSQMCAVGTCLHSAPTTSVIFPAQSYLWVTGHDTQTSLTSKRAIMSAANAADLVKSSLQVQAD